MWGSGCSEARKTEEKQPRNKAVTMHQEKSAGKYVTWGKARESIYSWVSPGERSKANPGKSFGISRKIGSDFSSVLHNCDKIRAEKTQTKRSVLQQLLYYYDKKKW